MGPALPLIVGLIGWEIYGLGGMYGVALLVLLLAAANAVATDDRGSAAAGAQNGGPDDRAPAPGPAAPVAPAREAEDPAPPG